MRATPSPRVALPSVVRALGGMDQNEGYFWATFFRKNHNPMKRRGIL